MEIFDANVLIQFIVTEENSRGSRANIALLVGLHECHKMSIPKFKLTLPTWNLQSQSSKPRSLRYAKTKKNLQILIPI